MRLLVEANIAKVDIEGNLVSPEQRDFFEYTTVRRGNKLIPVYHGTNAEFNEFNHELIGNNGDEHGPGFYFAVDKETAERYGKAKKYYLDISRPINTEKLTLTYVKVHSFLKKLDPDGTYYLEAWDDVYSNGIDNALDIATKELLDSSESNWDLVCNVYGSYSGDMKHFCETVKKFIGDGVTYELGGSKNYIVLTPQQIKLVTNINPGYGSSKVDE